MEVGNGEDSCTSTISEYTCIHDPNVILIDSPGLGDSRGAEKEREILDEVKTRMDRQPVSLFCFVVKKDVFDAPT